MGLHDLPTMAEVEAGRAFKPQPKGKSRLQAREEAKPLTLFDEKAFKAAVIKRDGDHCRRCHRKVIASLARVKERREIHHIHGKRGDLRFEDRAACVLCLECHEKVTGKVNERVVIIPTKTFTMRGETYTDARAKLLFRRAV